MNHTDSDKYLTEKVLGECWHEYPNTGRRKYFCPKCGFHNIYHESYDYPKKNYDFSTGNGFIKLWDACQKKEWWPDFWWDSSSQVRELNVCSLAAATAKVINMVNPDRFANAVYEFLKEREDDSGTVEGHSYFDCLAIKKNIRAGF